MENAVYATLARQSGLEREMQAIAHNLANLATTGYRREGLVFAEHVRAVDGGPALSLAHANARWTGLLPGAQAATGGSFDFAIDGAGFFLVETPAGERLTRAGRFSPDAAGELVTADGHRLLDEGGGPVFVPPTARAVTLAIDGTLAADGVPLARIGLWEPVDPTRLDREAGTLFAAPGGVRPAEGGTLHQGFLEESNVVAVTEVARMIEVSRAYELGQGFLAREDDRQRAVIRTLGR